MCSINGTCGCNRASGGFLLALTGRALWELVRLLAKAAQLLLVALILAAKWAAPRGWRLTVRGSRAAWRWYATRPIPMDRRRPAAAVADKPADKQTAMTLADLRFKEPANR